MDIYEVHHSPFQETKLSEEEYLTLTWKIRNFKQYWSLLLIENDALVNHLYLLSFENKSLMFAFSKHPCDQWSLSISTKWNNAIPKGEL